MGNETTKVATQTGHTDPARLLSDERAKDALHTEDSTEKLGHLVVKLAVSTIVGIAASKLVEAGLDALWSRNQNKTTE